VVQLTPPHPSTFVWALHHLYTGALSRDHKELLKVALDKGDADTFWGLYQNASFLDCATLMDECIGVLEVFAQRLAPYRNETAVQLFTKWACVPGSDHPSAGFRHPSFQPSNVGPVALVKMLHLNFVHSEAPAALRLFMLLSWMDNEECEGQQDYPVELTQMIDVYASRAIQAGSKLLKAALDAFPSVFHRVITPERMLPHLEKLEKVAHDAELMYCENCRELFPRSTFGDSVCLTVGHSGSYIEGSGWSCCRAPREGEGCSILRGEHSSYDGYEPYDPLR
jgi:hypothetical protein